MPTRSTIFYNSKNFQFYCKKKMNVAIISSLLFSIFSILRTCLLDPLFFTIQKTCNFTVKKNVNIAIISSVLFSIFSILRTCLLDPQFFTIQKTCNFTVKKNVNIAFISSVLSTIQISRRVANFLNSLIPCTCTILRSLQFCCKIL